jgi:hypothetical protein
MFCSTNGPNFIKQYPELESFILNKDKKYLDPRLKLLCYYNPTYVDRQTGVAGLTILPNKFITLSEISYFPFGYILLIVHP